MPPLELVWKHIGYAGDELDAQHRSVVKRIGSLISDLTADAEQHEQQLIDSIHEKQAVVHKMMKELGQPSSVEVL